MNIERSNYDSHDRFDYGLKARASQESNVSMRDAPLRPEVIARGRALAADDSYPPFSVCEKIAKEWLGSANLAG